MNLPIEIKRKDYNGNDFSITAVTNYSCNYNCEYCYNLKYKSNELLDLNILDRFIKTIVFDTKKTIDLYLIGGEPTLHPGLLKFATQFNIQKYGGMNIFTNLSYDIELYKKLIDENVTIIASYHNFNKKHTEDFINKVILLHQYTKNDLIKINIMFEKNNIENSLYVYDNLKKYVKQIELCLEFNQKYSAEQYYEFKIRHDSEKYEIDPLIITFSDKSIKELYFNDLINSHMFDVKKWLCNAGYDSFYINVNGDLYQCASYFFEKNKCIGNIKFSNIKYKRTICTCQDCCNFYIHKKKIFV